MKLVEILREILGTISTYKQKYLQVRKEYEKIKKDYEDMKKHYENVKKEYDELKKDYDEARNLILQIKKILETWEQG